MPSSEPRLLDLILIERGVYVRVFDLDYQAEQFEVFHTHAATRWTHYVGTQVIVGALLLLSWHLQLGPAPLAPLLAVGLCAWYLRLQWQVGLVATLQVGVLTGVTLLLSGLGASAWHALIALALAALAQNLSHSSEPVPPMLTGRHFEAFPVYWRLASHWHRLRVLLLNVLYVPLELVSAPRLFAVHVLRAMQALGFAPAWAQDVRARAARILAEPR